EDAVHKRGAAIARIAFFEGTARRQISIADRKDRFFVMLPFREKSIFRDGPHSRFDCVKMASSITLETREKTTHCAPSRNIAQGSCYGLGLPGARCASTARLPAKARKAPPRANVSMKASTPAAR